MMKMGTRGNIVQAKYGEWQASLFGACFIAFGLGVLLAGYLGWLALPAIVIGTALHGWGMYKTYNRNK